MEVLCLQEWKWDKLTRGIVCLPHSAKVHQSSHLLDQDRGQFLLSKLLVDAQEVYGADFKSVLVGDHLLRGSHDAREKLVFTSGSHAKMPFLLVSWDLKPPSEKLLRVLKSEAAVLVFDVVVAQQVPELSEVIIVLDVKLHELKAIRQSHWLSAHFGDLLAFLKWSVFLWVIFHEFPDWLSVPECMFLGEGHHLTQCLLLPGMCVLARYLDLHLLFPCLDLCLPLGFLGLFLDWLGSPLAFNNLRFVFFLTV